MIKYTTGSWLSYIEKYSNRNVYHCFGVKEILDHTYQAGMKTGVAGLTVKLD